MALPRARHVASSVALGVLAVLGLACRREARPARVPPDQHLVACTLEDWPSVIAELRDPAGRPIARGATLEIRSKSFRDRTRATDAFDTLHLGAGHRVAGDFWVRASKPGYLSAETTGVHVRGGPCGALERVIVPLTLRPRLPARGVHSVVIFGTGVGLGPGVYSITMAAYVNAADGVDTTVEWRSSNTRVVTVDQRGKLTSRCLARRTTAMVTATSRADARRRARIPVEVFGDPKMCERR